VLSSSYCLSKALVAIFQTVRASFTLWRARGNQTDVYGYAAFGLTVAPYLVMSMVNLISIVQTRDNSALCLVHTDIMEETERHQGGFEGVTGQILWTTDACKCGDLYAVFDVQDGRTFMCVNRKQTPYTADQPVDDAHQAEPIEVDLSATVRHRPRYQNVPRHQPLFLPLFFGETGSSSLKYFTDLSLITSGSVFFRLISLAIIGSISGFKEGHSTHTQRFWTMMWLALGIVLGPFYGVAKKAQRMVGGQEQSLWKLDCCSTALLPLVAS
jgi:hypothetical protein